MVNISFHIHFLCSYFIGERLISYSFPMFLKFECVYNLPAEVACCPSRYYGVHAKPFQAISRPFLCICHYVHAHVPRPGTFHEKHGANSEAMAFLLQAILAKRTSQRTRPDVAIASLAPGHNGPTDHVLPSGLNNKGRREEASV